MKKQYAALAAFILALQCMPIISITKKDLSYDLAFNLRSVFERDNIFKNEITSSTLAGWTSVIKRTRTFVEENSKNQLGIKDNDLMNPLATIEKANTDLINVIQKTYKLRNSNTGLKPEIDAFNKIKQAMITVQNNLKKATFFLNKEQKTEAKEILIETAKAIEKAAAKAILDTAKM